MDIRSSRTLQNCRYKLDNDFKKQQLPGEQNAKKSTGTIRRGIMKRNSNRDLNNVGQNYALTGLKLNVLPTGEPTTNLSRLKQLKVEQEETISHEPTRQRIKTGVRRRDLNFRKDVDKDVLSLGEGGGKKQKQKSAKDLIKRRDSLPKFEVRTDKSTSRPVSGPPGFQQTSGTGQGVNSGRSDTVSTSLSKSVSLGEYGVSSTRKDGPQYTSSPTNLAYNRVKSAASTVGSNSGVVSPFDHEKGQDESRTLTAMSGFSSTSLNVSFDTKSPLSAWSDYAAPNYMEMRERLLKGRFGPQFENYIPHVPRKKVVFAPTPTKDEDYDTDLDDEGFDLVMLERVRQRTQDSPFPDYKSTCRKSGTVPNSYFLRHALDDDLDMRFRYPGPLDTKALAQEIRTDATVDKLDLSENGLEPAQLISVAEMLHNNTAISQINLSENNIGKAGARMLRCVLRSECRLHTLNLGGNKLGDKGAKYIATGLERNVFVKDLNLSHNEIGEVGVKHLCHFLAGNVTLDVLDVSWNHIRKHGAVMLARAVKVNQQLRVLRVSMNGFGVEGARALRDTLEENTTLLELDVSANRIPRAGARAIASGLDNNTELRCLKIGFNPLTPEGADAILESVECRENTEGMEVDLEGVYVSQDFESQALDLMKDNRIKITFTFEPSRRGRSRDDIGGYIRNLHGLLLDLKIDLCGVFNDVTEDDVIVSGNDVIQRLRKSKRQREKLDHTKLNDFIYSYGNRRFQIRDWNNALGGKVSTRED